MAIILIIINKKNENAMTKTSIIFVLIALLTSCATMNSPNSQKIEEMRKRMGYKEVNQRKLDYFGYWEAVNPRYASYPNIEIGPKTIRFKDTAGNQFHKSYNLDKGSGFGGIQYHLLIDDFGQMGRTWWVISVEKEGLNKFLYFETRMGKVKYKEISTRF